MPDKTMPTFFYKQYGHKMIFMSRVYVRRTADSQVLGAIP